MDSSVWDKALKILQYDPNIDIVTYESILSKMTVGHSDDIQLVLEARDEYSLSIVKSQKLGKTIENAIKLVNGDKPCVVNFILKGDKHRQRLR